MAPRTSALLLLLSGCAVAQPAVPPPIESAPAARAALASNVKWELRQSRYADLYIATGSRATPLAQSLARSVDRAVEENVAWLGAPRTGPKLRLFFVGSRDEMRPHTGSAAGGWSVTDEGTAFFVANDSTRPAIKHETMHLISWREWGRPGGVWLSEGVASAAVGLCLGQTPEEITVAARDAGLFAPLDTLRRAFNFAGEVGVVHYLESAALVNYIDRTYGRAKLKEVWKSGLAGLPAVLGVEVAALERGWLASLAAVRPKSSWAAFSEHLRTRGCE